MLAVDLAEGDFSEVPDDFDYVLNFAVSFDPSFDVVFSTIVEGLGLLMSHCRNAKAFLHCSTTGVYQFKDQRNSRRRTRLGIITRSSFPPTVSQRRQQRVSPALARGNGTSPQ